MDDLDKYIENRKAKSPDFADGFEIGYEQFKIGVMLRMAREDAGLTQEQVAERDHQSAQPSHSAQRRAISPRLHVPSHQRREARGGNKL